MTTILLMVLILLLVVMFLITLTTLIRISSRLLSIYIHRLRIMFIRYSFYIMVLFLPKYKEVKNINCLTEPHNSSKIVSL